jgi:hypothetical protein
MASSEPRASALLWLAFLSLSVVACQSTPRHLDPAEYTDDFGDSIGTEQIDEDSIGAQQMLHRRTRIEPYLRAVVPFESNFDVGSAIGARASIEVQKHLFVGGAFDWVHMSTADDIENAGGGGVTLAATESSELYTELDRFNFLGTFDYDIHLADEFLLANSPLTLGLGFGAGLTIVTGDEAQGLISRFDLEPYFGPVFRPSADFRWQLAEQGFFTLNLSFDWVPTDEIEIDFLGERREVDDPINFSTFNIGLGYTFEF